MIIHLVISYTHPLIPLPLIYSFIPLFQPICNLHRLVAHLVTLGQCAAAIFGVLVNVRQCIVDLCLVVPVSVDQLIIDLGVERFMDYY